MAQRNEDRIDAVMWSIVGSTTTMLGMSLGAMVLMQNGNIDRVLGTFFVIMTFVALVFVEGLLVWRFLKLSRGAADADDWDEEEDLTAVELDAPRTRALHHGAEPVAGVASHVRDTFQPLSPTSKEAERR